VSQSSGTPLLAEGPWSERCEALRLDLRAEIVPLTRDSIARSERENRFPRAVITGLGAGGHLRRRWAVDGPWGDVGLGIVLAHELAYSASLSIALGVSLHNETATSLLRSARPNAGGEDLYESAVSGAKVFCIAATEPITGSDLTFLQTTAVEVDRGWLIRGKKKFISLSITADMALVFARTGPGAEISVFAVPRAKFAVERVLEKHGSRGLETCLLDFDDALVPRDHLIGRRGQGIPLFLHAMSCERLAGCAMLLGGYRAAIEIAGAYMKRRKTQTGVLWDYQALRHGYADLVADFEVLWRAMLFTGWDLQTGRGNQRDLAALKLATAARVERGISDAMQMLGGAGYIDEFPLERMLRDVRLGRIGGGADQVMRNLVAATPITDEAYRMWEEQQLQAPASAATGT
jgi:acyl-ACP dehydrogenase